MFRYIKNITINKLLMVLTALSSGVIIILGFRVYQADTRTYLLNGDRSETIQRSKKSQLITPVLSRISSDKIIELTNKERIKVGLRPLEHNYLLEKSAKDKLKDMTLKNYWSHDSPDGKKPWNFILQSGYEYNFAGENLGKGFFDSESLMSSWMISSPHKENILKPEYKEIGVHVERTYFQGESTVLVVQMFGSPTSQGGLNYETQGVSIEEVRAHRTDTDVVKNNWIAARNRFPTDKVNRLVDSFTRQIAFCDQIIANYNKNGRFTNDDIALWQAVIKMANENVQLVNELNSL